MTLVGQVVVVTGASRGIGEATARELHRRGASVALLGRDTEALAAICASLDQRAAWFAADVTDHKSLTRAAEDVAARFGKVDSLIANAGMNRPGTIRTAHADDFAAIIDTNLIGVYRSVQVFLPELMATKGYVLLMSSSASSVGVGGMTAYAASKAGVESLAHTLRMESAHLGITIGSVHPWFADTALVRAGEAAMPTFADTRRRFAFLARVPGPIGLAGTTLTSQQCADVMADMVTRRWRKRHIPRSAGLLALTRPVLYSHLGERVQQLFFGQMMRRIEDETWPREAAID